GVGSIDNEGNIEIEVVGGGSNQSYDVAYRSPDGSTSSSLGTLTTGNQGNGALRKNHFFALNKAGTGNIVLSRNGSDQYVTGVNVASEHTRGGPDFRPQLVACSAISVPAALQSCGGDTFKNGTLSIDSDDGDLEISVSGASANVTYAVVLRPASGSDLALST